MPKLVQTFRVEFANGETFDVDVDQRDIAAWEKHKDYDRDRMNTAVRFMAFNAARRQGLTAVTESAWEGQVVEVTSVDGEIGPADPGNPETSATTSSTSPSSPGSPSRGRRGSRTGTPAT